MVQESFDCYLLDIEGTICPISFVKETLFPFFLQNLSKIIEHPTDDQLTILSKFNINDSTELYNHINNLVLNDIKDPILKQLQGHVWQEGYENGLIKAPIYQDSIEFIKDNGNRIYIYSSGSVRAQKLLFEFVACNDGKETIDLRPSILDYFDINTSGVKTESSSYDKIAKTIEHSEHRERILFLSDNPKELEAASSAGLSTRLVIRPGNAPVEDDTKYTSIRSLSEL
ncbi:hypothetical protein Kpol_1059p21 [Vanderwaltozyma polyspora DSM 70294]|uniref:Enolase-phosphatase E1 n=1 Tax=Vanderwaltozyma polyspora (strain ATCC 22028 / DSM 70294 / BCRC 21397 / CBS 2163 / NBRC 10782 / NRRL Y-8283 / UCD 57-17) TaxID=436907 RepID=ENOPH_VANPO|nr:uncharacterized protein Kpol_1059p21 [Vanderwaltozyma polyspora DSM 70294]A7TN25.1 RecName: Full=Enolase-phosphatase E1; AltName: Full=2,3-diketo-5-methylthio-1-phosphopentane phosphatase [Vanderwaltozyma polyspora DSM 70294]EDO16331.1 hypothetical protein Kpol_1059p21 [Vanderwaltozyma polyspora DSM 70294]